MAREIREFAVTVPAGTLKATPQTTDLAMPTRIVRQITIRVPPGPSGRVGFAVAAAGVAILPRNAGAWVVTDDEIIPWPLDDQIESGAWQLKAYNEGIYDHTLYLRFQLDLPAQPGTGPLLPLSISAQ